MINFTKNISVFFIVLAMALSTARADDAAPPVTEPPAADTLVAAPSTAADTAAGPVSADTLAAAPVSAAAPAPDAVLGPEPAPPAASISYTGALLSAVVPGAGQVYHKKYIMGAGFLSAEVIAGIVALNRRDNWIDLTDKSKRLQDTGWAWRREAAAAAYNGDTVTRAHNDSVAGRYFVLSDRSVYEARYSKYTAYNALAWTVGIHYYSFMDALERGGVTERGKVKGPITAGFLAAVPFLGLGQLYNEHPGKAGMISMAQASLAVIAINNHRLMEHASGKYNEMRDSTSAQFAYRNEHLSYWKTRYDQAFSQRNTYLWISLFAYLYTIFDAVVDAHLSDYMERIHFGPDLSIGADGAGASLKIGF